MRDRGPCKFWTAGTDLKNGLSARTQKLTMPDNDNLAQKMERLGHRDAVRQNGGISGISWAMFPGKKI